VGIHHKEKQELETEIENIKEIRVEKLECISKMSRVLHETQRTLYSNEEDLNQLDQKLIYLQNKLKEKQSGAFSNPEDLV